LDKNEIFRKKEPHPRLSPAKNAGQAREEPDFNTIEVVKVLETKVPFRGFRGLNSDD
jgi:hypothetical protein